MEGEEVTVAEGQSLADLALAHNLSPSRLQMINELYPPIVEPGMRIRLEDPGEMLIQGHSIFAILSNSSVEVPGTLTFTTGSIIFKQRQIRAENPAVEVRINVVSVVSTSLVPHMSFADPDRVEDADQPAILVVCYLLDPLDASSLTAVSFVAPRAELNAANFHLKKVSSERKLRSHFTTPVRAMQRAETATEELSKMNALPSKMRKTASVITRRTFVLDGESAILDDVNITELRKSLPYQLKHQPWKNIFRISTHGTTFIGLFEAARKTTHCILVIKTVAKAVFGVFLSEGLRPCSRDFGTEETFVFRYNPDLEVFRWSKRNRHFAATTSNDVLIGGGECGAAIWIEREMINGVSDPCQTFDSPCLAGERDFRILDMEIWDVLPKTV
jgi:hypothetical protein